MRYFKLLAAIIFWGSILVGNSMMPVKSASSLLGRLEVIWGTRRYQQMEEQARSWLLRPDGERLELLFSGGQFENIPPIWIGKQVEVTGEYRALNNGVKGFLVETIKLREVGTLDVSSTYTGNTPWVTVLCKYKDFPDEPKPASYFLDMYGSDAPRLVSYWKEVSYNLIDVSNSNATASWHVLPQNREYYLYDNNGDGQTDVDFTRLNSDCLELADPEIDFRNYKGIQFIVNADLANASWGGYQTFTLDGESRVWMATWLPDWGYKDLSVVEHEMGHGYGMKHSTAPNGQLYSNQWDVMSDALSNCSNSYDSIFSCLGQHPISFSKDMVGWLASERKMTVNQGVMETVLIERLAQPVSNGILMVTIPINGQTDKFYTVEVRKKIGYDKKLPGEGVVLHKIDKTKQVMAEVIDFDNNNNTGDEAAVWTPGESWEDTANGIWVSVRVITENGYEVIISNASGSSIPPFPQPPRDKFLYLPFIQNANGS
jgi:M6 family metalloprotease-like protein